MRTNLSAAFSFLAAVVVLPIPAFATESVEVRLRDVSRTEATIEVAHDGGRGFVLRGRLEFTDPETGEIVASVPLPRTVVYEDAARTVSISAPIPDDAALPRRLYRVRVVADAILMPLGDAAIAANTGAASPP